jgi:hypothetical protein
MDALIVQASCRGCIQQLRIIVENAGLLGMMISYCAVAYNLGS